MNVLTIIRLISVTEAANNVIVHSASVSLAFWTLANTNRKLARDAGAA